MFNMLFLSIVYCLITLIMIIFNWFISIKKINNREKLSPFECGFDPLSSPRLPFSIQFYLISIIFLIFDVEIVIFLPMIYSYIFNKYMFWMETSTIFILILLLGLYIEWNNGALTWMK